MARIVPVAVHGNATTTPNTVHCSKSNGDQIEWRAADGQCDVSFDAGVSPFAPQGASDPDSYYMLRQGETRQTPPVSSDAMVGGHSYDIYSGTVQGTGTVIIDP